MNDDNDRPPSNGIDDFDEIGEDDLGTPISELFDFEIETGDEFLTGVRRRIERREMAATALDLSLVNAGQVIWSYLEMVLESLFASKNGAGGGSPNRPRSRKDS
ncbi:MAG: hypothetical protein R3E97_01115 [Candidatus Eisenbacteria bacterium]